jgi:4-amino-4-deoxychorismate lyase
MPIQKSSLAKSDELFGLIETLLWIKGSGYRLLDERIGRLTSSARTFGIPCDRSAVLEALKHVVIEPHRGRLRVRLVLDDAGGCTVSVKGIDEVRPDAIWRAVVATTRVESSDPMLRHKTTRRERYEGELARAAQCRAADEVVFLNERDEVCEGARSNIFVARNGMLLTPPLGCGLLPGTLRGSLLAQGSAREAILRLDDIAEGATWYMGNSVRGLIRTHMVRA